MPHRTTTGHAAAAVAILMAGTQRVSLQDADGRQVYRAWDFGGPIPKKAPTQAEAERVASILNNAEARRQKKRERNLRDAGRNK